MYKFYSIFEFYLTTGHAFLKKICICDSVTTSCLPNFQWFIVFNNHFWYSKLHFFFYVISISKKHEFLAKFVHDLIDFCQILKNFLVNVLLYMKFQKFRFSLYIVHDEFWHFPMYMYICTSDVPGLKNHGGYF